LSQVTDLVPVPPARGAVAAWGLWDWAFSAFSAVAPTSFFSTYLSNSAFGDPARESELLGSFTAGAGIATLSCGTLDHRLGPKPVIVALAIAVSPATGTAARTSWGILGIIVGLVAGLALLLPVKPGQSLQAPAPQDAGSLT
jgi:MFS-type transporter involved in bile tolerance (Atg22 family)